MEIVVDLRIIVAVAAAFFARASAVELRVLYRLIVVVVVIASSFISVVVVIGVLRLF